MSDVAQELADAKKRLTLLETKRIEVSTRLSALEDEKNKIVADSAALGVNPKEIDKAIAELEATITTELVRVKGVLEGFGVI